jgi:hypothetical protein
MQPGRPAGPRKARRWLGPLRRPVDHILSAGTSSDPLYLTNRTFGQKLKAWTLIGLPCLMVAGAIGIMLSHWLAPPEPTPIREPTPAELAAKLLPNLDQTIKIETNRDLEVVNVRVVHSGATKVVGVVKNNTAHMIAVAEVVFDLTNMAGSQLGGVSGKVNNIPAGATRDFEIVVKQEDADFALVREIHAQ